MSLVRALCIPNLTIPFIPVESRIVGSQKSRFRHDASSTRAKQASASENGVSIEGSPIRYELFRSESITGVPAQTVKEASQTLMSRYAVTRMESDVERKNARSMEREASRYRKKRSPLIVHRKEKDDENDCYY